MELERADEIQEQLNRYAHYHICFSQDEIERIRILYQRLFEIISRGKVDLFASLDFEQIETIYALVDETCPHWTEAGMCNEARSPIHDMIPFPEALPVLKYHCQNNREDDHFLEHSFLAFVTYFDYNSSWQQLELCLKYNKFEKEEVLLPLPIILAQNCHRENEILEQNKQNYKNCIELILQNFNRSVFDNLEIWKRALRTAPWSIFFHRFSNLLCKKNLK